ncbi:MAG: methylcrotonoyl-CoA carboxylase [Rhizobiales bacterium NRL2]|jgi:3-methylcrotonyl-CoA carboxylase beta subunit|nr:MAG: methylcrotonoyl-CoA carboxylase [Rhizobiales bacterium NRL2]
MNRIQSRVSTASDDYKRFRAHNEKMIAEFREAQDAARFQRPQRDIDRLTRQSKMTARERIDLLLDPGTPFLELSTLAANQAYDGGAPGAGQVVGIGTVSGREVIIRADDPSVKGGAWYPLSIKKIVRCLDIAIENRLPVVHLCDSAGGFLPLQSTLFADRYYAGRIFRNQSTLSKLACKQLALVFGHCTAGGAYIPALSDYSIMVRGNGGVFLGGPPLVKAATGEEHTADEIGGADLHTQISGTVDFAADDERHAIDLGREIVAQWERAPKTPIQRQDFEEPYYDPDELLGVIPDDVKIQFDMREVIARLVDGSRFLEYQPDYGTTLVAGFAHIWGYKVGILGNNGVLFNDSTLKATHFMELCNQNNTPLVFLQNITGFMVGRDYEMAGITKDGAKMIMVQTNSKVPKFTVMTNGSFGAGNYGMCGRAFDPRFLFSWPNHRISVMGEEQAAKTLAEIKIAQLKRLGEDPDQKEIDEIFESVARDYRQQASAWWSTSEIWDDGMIDPRDTRNALGLAIQASLNAPFGTDGYGVLRL